MPLTRQGFDQQIESLTQSVVRLGAVVQDMLQKSLHAFLTRNDPLAEEVIRQDDVADGMDLGIEQQCIRLLALQQPMSKDLRTIVTFIKVIADLERIGDYSVDIAKTGQHISQQPFFQPMVNLSGIGDRVQQIVRDTLRAFVDRDLELAHRICKYDDEEIDRLHDELFEELLQRMRREPEIVPQATRILFVSRYLERIADHCTNIAERTVYMETGRPGT